MKRGSVIGTAMALVAVVALALVPSALAKRTGLFAGVNVQASNGYQVFIGAEHWKHHHGRVTVTAERSDLYAWSTYQARARLTRHHLKADLGKFGRINLRYQPGRRPALTSASPKAPESGSLASRLFQRLGGCGVLLDGRKGRFRGRIRFRGEDGYTSVRAHKARGFISPAKTDCSKTTPDHGVALDAGDGTVRFEADRFRGRSKEAFFLAKEEETEGPVAISRIALGGGYKASFTFAFNPDQAHVAPRSTSFTGSADLTPSNQWTGSLSVSFPGDPKVPLTGPEFSAQLGHF